MDHEFFTPIGNFQMVNWDWFSLHLSDSTAVMLARWHRDPSYSTGTFVNHDGATRALSPREVMLVPQAWWTSPTSGGKYPIEWKIKFLDYDLQLRTPVKNQELDTRRTTSNFYWEGYVEVFGKKRERTISGEGYLEMTGYTK
jgi:predicted secreted hydrolase